MFLLVILSVLFSHIGVNFLISKAVVVQTILFALEILNSEENFNRGEASLNCTHKIARDGFPPITDGR